MPRPRPTIKTKPISADHGYARTAEVFFPIEGLGCLISLRIVDGKPTVEVYRADPGLKVMVDQRTLVNGK